MPTDDILFETDANNDTTVSTNTANNQDDATALDHTKDVVDVNDNNNNGNEPNQQAPQDDNVGDKGNNNDNYSTGGLSAGQELEIDGSTYVVDDKGNIVTPEGEIFKEAKDVDDWLKTVQVNDGNSDEDHDDNELSIDNIQNKLGLQVVDNEGNPVEFSNDLQGITSYVQSVIADNAEQVRQATLNKLYADNPILYDFVNYLAVNNNDPRGFGELRDRTNVVLDKENEAQQIAIIKQAAIEFGNKSLNDSYINYLKNTGSLFDEANAQLAALQEKDKNTKAQIAEQAKQQKEEQQAVNTAYWNKVADIIGNRNIAGYAIPESIVREVNGKKFTLTPNDFYNYLYKQIPQEDGTSLSGYQADLHNLTDEEYMNRELLDAWLLFTGGTYKDLVDMAVKKDTVNKLRITSKKNSTRKTVKINTNTPHKVDINDIVF